MLLLRKNAGKTFIESCHNPDIVEWCPVAIVTGRFPEYAQI